MKIKKGVLPVLILLLFGCTAHAFGTAAYPKQPPQIPATPVELGADVNSLVFTGTVKRIPDGTALVTNNATYMLAGGNFEGIVGKEVNIIGKVIKEGSIEKILVARAQLTDE